MKSKVIDVKKETIEKCNEFSSKFFSILNSVFFSGKSYSEHRKEITELAKQIQTLETEDKDLFNYLEDAILNKNHKEFIVPYYLINHDINPDIQNYEEKSHFGLLGTAKEIISEGGLD